MLRAIFAGAGALALSACAFDTSGGIGQSMAERPTSGVVAKADTVILTGERGFAAAEIVYTTAANGVGRLVDQGVIRGATATRVRGWNAEARRLLVTGKATADAAERARAAASLFGLADNLNSLLGSK